MDQASRRFLEAHIQRLQAQGKPVPELYRLLLAQEEASQDPAQVQEASLEVQASPEGVVEEVARAVVQAQETATQAQDPTPGPRGGGAQPLAELGAQVLGEVLLRREAEARREALLSRPAPGEVKPVLPPLDPWAVAAERVEALAREVDLDPREEAVLTVLVAVALAYLLRARPDLRRIPEAVREAYGFMVLEGLALALGLPYRTFHRVLGRLEAKGLLKRSPWRTEAMIRGLGGVYTAGVVYSVRLAPSGKARLPYGVYRVPWRNLDADRAEGRTVQKWVKAPVVRVDWGEAVEVAKYRTATEPGVIQRWQGLKNTIQEDAFRAYQVIGSLLALEPGGPAKGALGIDPATAEPFTDSEWVQAMAGLYRLTPGDRAQAIDHLAKSLARRLRDPDSLEAFAWLIWRGLRAQELGIAPDALQVIAWAFGQALLAVNRPRQTIRRPGALVMSLVGRDLLETLRHLPQAA